MTIFVVVSNTVLTSIFITTHVRRRRRSRGFRRRNWHNSDVNLARQARHIFALRRRVRRVRCDRWVSGFVRGFRGGSVGLRQSDCCSSRTAVATHGDGGVPAFWDLVGGGLRGIAFGAGGVGLGYGGGGGCEAGGAEVDVGSRVGGCGYGGL